MRELIAYFKRNKKELVVVCDAYAHHRDWGSTNINVRGEQLYNYIIDGGAFKTKNNAEILDITISTQFVSTNIIN